MAGVKKLENSRSEQGEFRRQRGGLLGEDWSCSLGSDDPGFPEQA